MKDSGVPIRSSNIPQLLVFLVLATSALGLAAPPGEAHPRSCQILLAGSSPQVWDEQVSRLNLQAGTGFTVLPTRDLFPEDWAKKIYSSLCQANRFISLVDGSFVGPQAKATPIDQAALEDIRSRVGLVVAELSKRAHLIDPALKGLRLLDDNPKRNQIRVIHADLLPAGLATWEGRYTVLGEYRMHKDGGWLRATITLIGSGTRYDSAGTVREAPRGDMFVFTGSERSQERATLHAGVDKAEDRLVLVLTLGPVY